MKGNITLENVRYFGKTIFYCISMCICFLLLTGCVAGITNTQQREMEGYKAKGLFEEEKNPGTAAALGILPGGGSFYTRHYGLGVVDLLFWPISIFWDPVNGSNGAETINYYATKEAVNKQMEKEIRKLDEDLQDNKITEKEYILEQRKIKAKYTVD